MARGMANFSDEKKAEVIAKAQAARKKNREDRKAGIEVIKSDKPFSLMKRIKMKCIECSCGSKLEVALCTVKDCSLWPVRRGRHSDKLKVKEIVEEVEELKEVEPLPKITEKDSSDLSINENDIKI